MRFRPSARGSGGSGGNRRRMKQREAMTVDVVHRLRGRPLLSIHAKSCGRPSSTPESLCLVADLNSIFIVSAITNFHCHRHRPSSSKQHSLLWLYLINLINHKPRRPVNLSIRLGDLHSNINLEPAAHQLSEQSTFHINPTLQLSTAR